jgi:SAM-dependent methyltransferase
MKISYTFFVIGMLLLVLELACAGSAVKNTPGVKSSIPYVATRNDAVRDMLWMANVGKDDVVYDLGSGDGRIVIAAVRDFGARRAVGIENDPNRIQESRRNAQKAGVADRVEFIQGDLFSTDFRQASVVTLFLGHEPNIKLRPKLFSDLKPGTRIVSHQFCMGEWLPDKALTARTVYFGMWGERERPFRDNPNVPDYTENEMHHGTSDKMTMWVVPAPVAGIWRAKIQTAEGLQDCQLILHQHLSEVQGTLQISGQTNLTENVSVDMWGTHVRFVSGLMKKFEVRFDGYVNEDTMQGTLAVRDQGKLQEGQWEAHRDKVEFAGTWEWPCATGQRSVRLNIEQKEGHFVATYQDKDKTVPVTDFYNFGGGFYFTHMIGLNEDNGLVLTEDTGWLIGQGVLIDGQLKGTIGFYPYEEPVRPGMPQGKDVSQSWTPRLIKP